MSTFSSLLEALKKISMAVFNFRKKEEEIVKAGKEIVENAIKESDQKKITELKNKINNI